MAASHIALGSLPTTAMRLKRRQVPSAAAAPVIDSSGSTLSPVELFQSTRRLQTQTMEIATDTTTIRSLDWDRDRFDIEFGLQNGTTYNSFIIQGEEKTALVDASHSKFRELYMKALKGVIDLSKIDYIIVSHTEPDHSGLIGELLELIPDVTIVASKVALAFLRDLMNREFSSITVKSGDSLDLGGGHLLSFVSAPNLHWPDTMFTHDAATGILYTCDAFGAHYCTEDIWDSDLKELVPHFRFYYDCLMRPNAKSVLTALRKINGLEISAIATGHGPLLGLNIPELMDSYEKWSKAVGKSKASVIVFYHADYGYSDRLSQAVAKGITKAGVAVEMEDLASIETQELVEAVARHKGVVLMAPNHGSESALSSYATLLGSVKSSQKFLICESYGGSDEPVDTMQRQLMELGLDPASPPIRIKNNPCEAVYQIAEESGTDLAQLLTKKERTAAQKDSMSADIAKALGRISGGLYIVTAAKGSPSDDELAKSAMVASWVSQASFEPLGLSIAVAKDRAIESFMQVNDTFGINCLEEGNATAAMKHFLQRFPPGADRFEGIKHHPFEDSTSEVPVLDDAIAFMECVVRSRMEGPDHWIVYAEVVNGLVMKPDSRTAVHHRKVGSYY